jgi:hypothetical protein
MMHVEPEISSPNTGGASFGHVSANAKSILRYVIDRFEMKTLCSIQN